MAQSLSTPLLLLSSSFSLSLCSLPGIPGQDYPTLDFFNLPDTSFDCNDRVNGGWVRGQIYPILTIPTYPDCTLTRRPSARCTTCACPPLTESSRSSPSSALMGPYLTKTSWPVTGGLMLTAVQMLLMWDRPAGWYDVHRHYSVHFYRLLWLIWTCWMLRGHSSPSD